MKEKAQETEKKMERYSKIFKGGKKIYIWKHVSLVLLNGLDIYIFPSIKIVFQPQIDFF